MRKFFLLLFLSTLTLLFFFAAKDFAHAQNEESEDSESSAQNSGGVSITPDFEDIDEDTRTVNIQFREELYADNYYACLSTEGCTEARRNKVEEISAEDARSLNVCADGPEELKIAEEDECDPEDYWHGGSVYRLQLFEDEELLVKGPDVAFFVHHIYPGVNIQSDTGEPLRVNITETRRPPDVTNRNNYQVVIEGTDQYGNQIKDDRCITVRDGDPGLASFGREDNEKDTPIRPGNYVIKVNEQINEGGFVGLRDKCNGGFTFWHASITIEDNGALKDGPINCISSKMGDIEDSHEACAYDPNNSDARKLNELIEELSGISNIDLVGDLKLCNKFEEEGDIFQCIEIDTAIGNIPTNIQSFIERLFTIILSIAGISALGLLIYGGYRYMTSQGDPERIKGARETITSAIIGLLFIIFSLVILQIITGDILRIPGFNEPDPGQEQEQGTGVDRVDDGTIPGNELPGANR